jgi:hypothetical protein
MAAVAETCTAVSTSGTAAGDGSGAASGGLYDCRGRADELASVAAA